MNKHFVIGKIGKEIVLNGEGDRAWIQFSIATSDFVGKGKGENKQDGTPGDYVTNWHDVVAFGRQAEFIAGKFTRGDAIAVEGPVFRETYDKKDGTGKGYSSRIKLKDFQGPFAVKTANGNANGQAQASAPSNGQGSRGAGNGQRSAPQQGGQRSAPRQAPQQPVYDEAPVLTDDDIPF